MSLEERFKTQAMPQPTSLTITGEVGHLKEMYKASLA